MTETSNDPNSPQLQYQVKIKSTVSRNSGTSDGQYIELNNGSRVSSKVATVALPATGGSVSAAMEGQHSSVVASANAARKEYLSDVEAAISNHMPDTGFANDPYWDRSLMRGHEAKDILSDEDNEAKNVSDWTGDLSALDDYDGASEPPEISFGKATSSMIVSTVSMSEQDEGNRFNGQGTTLITINTTATIEPVDNGGGGGQAGEAGSGGSGGGGGSEALEPTEVVEKVTLTFAMVLQSDSKVPWSTIQQYGFSPYTMTMHSYDADYVYPSLSVNPFVLELDKDAVMSMTEDSWLTFVRNEVTVYRNKMANIIREWALGGIVFADQMRSKGIRPSRMYDAEYVETWYNASREWEFNAESAVKAALSNVQDMFTDETVKAGDKAYVSITNIPNGIAPDSSSIQNPKSQKWSNSSNSLTANGVGTAYDEYVQIIYAELVATTNVDEAIPKLNNSKEQLGDEPVKIKTGASTCLAITDNCKGPDGLFVPGVAELIEASQLKAHDILLVNDPIQSSLIPVAIMDVLTGERIDTKGLYLKGVSN